MNDIKEKTYKKELKKFVYSLRLTKAEHQLLKNNPGIKRDLNKLVRDYLNIYLE